ncbi:MAG: TonB-dependent receptor, partial [Myxococcales bacterium]|nr:TonB-dependent receptor [Myxococcales bacterium]
FLVSAIAPGWAYGQTEDPDSAPEQGDEAEEVDPWADEWSDPWADEWSDEPSDGESGEGNEQSPEGEQGDLDWEDARPAITLNPVTAAMQQLQRTGGSASVIGEEALEAFEYDDPHSILLQAPGVYVRQEDAFGLRPNIGLRGANSDRSKKVTLMEDEVLLAPAPYAAPAAYFFPVMTRMVGVEVFKGPASIVYGPNTIGGAINFVSRDVPHETEGMIDASLGSFLTSKTHAYFGTRGDNAGFLVEGVFLSSDGFKELDNGGDTGFRKYELALVGVFNSDPDRDVYHELQLRLTYANELSHETYLGLTDADFEANPYRRYAASQLGEMDWWRTQGRVRYRFEVGNTFDVTTTLYRHDFDRSWRKLNRFRSGPSLEDVLSDPDAPQNQPFYDVLSGNADSAVDAESLQIGINNRRYVSEGVQTEAHLRGTPNDWFAYDLELGLRVHYDQIERYHTEDAYDMVSGDLVPTGDPTVPTTDNMGSALAVATYIAAQLELAGFTLTPGLRMEWIHTEFENRLAESQPGEENPFVGSSTENTNHIFIPGIGVHYAITEEFGVLAGVHRGFSPVSPGQPDEVAPETSVNYEAGARYLDADQGTLLELVGFFNDYSNLTGECSFSSGCSLDQLDRQFNAGSVNVWGIEAVAGRTFLFGNDFYVPSRVAYTLTQSSFQTAFVSGNPQFGEVREGDELPYVPEHQLSIQLGVGQEGDSLRRWALNLNGTYVDAMQEQAGQGDDGLFTDASFLLDASLSWEPIDGLTLYARGDNLTDATPVVARRPFGARPARPLMVHGGVRYEF